MKIIVFIFVVLCFFLFFFDYLFFLLDLIVNIVNLSNKQHNMKANYIMTHLFEKQYQNLISVSKEMKLMYEIILFSLFNTVMDRVHKCSVTSCSLEQNII